MIKLRRCAYYVLDGLFFHQHSMSCLYVSLKIDCKSRMYHFIFVGKLFRQQRVTRSNDTKQCCTLLMRSSDTERDLCPERMPYVITTLLNAPTTGSVPCLQTKRQRIAVPTAENYFTKADWLCPQYIKTSAESFLRLMQAMCNNYFFFSPKDKVNNVRTLLQLIKVIFLQHESETMNTRPVLCSQGMYKVGIILKGGNKPTSLLTTTP